MGLFNSIQDLIGSVSDTASESTSNGVGEITDMQIVQDLQESITNISDPVTETTQSIQDSGQTAIDEIKKNVGF